MAHVSKAHFTNPLWLCVAWRTMLPNSPNYFMGSGKKIKHEPSIKNIFFQKAYKAYARKTHKCISSIIL